MVFRFLPSQHRLLHQLSTSEPPQLLTAQELERAFHKERQRSDRTEKGFSLAVFFPRGREASFPKRWERILRARLRDSDLAGSLDDHHVAILLPETSEDGARLFGEQALEILERSGLKSQCALYRYPRDWQRPSGTNGQPEVPAERRASDSSDTDLRVARSVSRVDASGDLEGVFVKPLPLWKRAMDVAGATLLLLALWPLFVTVALAVWATSEGPIFFRQYRAGLGGRAFRFYKFRSMHVDAESRREALLARNEATGPIFKLRNDPRLTPIGRFLRSTSIDELPQLWNVLKGDMSLVGPRPPIIEEVRAYRPWHRKRLSVTGGLTCFWQVSGRSEINDFEKWARLDLQYLKQRSLRTDVCLLWRTISAVATRRGAY